MAFKSSKSLLLRFVRRFYDSDVPYADVLIKNWVDSLVKHIIYILTNGFVLYIGLFALTFVFPKTQSFIFLGDKFWHFPFVVIFIGWIVWLFTIIYSYLRVNYKTGGVLR